MSFLNEKTSSYHWTSRATTIIRDSGKWLKNNIVTTSRHRTQITTKSKSPTPNSKTCLSKNFIINDHYNNNEKDFDLNMNQRFQKQQNAYINYKNQFIDCAANISNMNASSRKPSNEQNYTSKQEYKKVNEAKKQKVHHENCNKMHCNFPTTSALIETLSENSISPTNEHQSDSLFLSSLCMNPRSASERRKEHPYHQKKKYTKFINELSSMTISLPSSSWQQHQKMKPKAPEKLIIVSFKKKVLFKI